MLSFRNRNKTAKCTSEILVHTYIYINYGRPRFEIAINPRPIYHSFLFLINIVFPRARARASRSRTHTHTHYTRWSKRNSMNSCGADQGKEAKITYRININFHKKEKNNNSEIKTKHLVIYSYNVCRGVIIRIQFDPYFHHNVWSRAMQWMISRKGIFIWSAQNDNNWIHNNWSRTVWFP